MDDSHARKFQKDLNGGLVALVLLALLDQTPEDLYGYEIAKRLQKANEGEALFKEGTVYPVLGRAVLKDWSGIWRQTRNFVDRFIEGVER